MKWVALAALRVVVVTAAVIGAAALTIVLRVHVAERKWGGFLHSVPQRYQLQMNQTTADLPDKASALGLAFHVHSAAPPKAGDPLNGITEELVEYANELSDVPPSVRRYVRQRRGAFDEFAKWVLQNPPPVTTLELRDIRDAHMYVPDMVKLQRLMIAAADVRYGEGDHAAAERLLEASWQLTDQWRKTPVVDHQLLALSVLRMQLRALRKFNVDSQKWLPRLQEHDYRASMVAAHEVEAYLTLASVRNNLYIDPQYWHGLGAAEPRNTRLVTAHLWFSLPAELEGKREVVHTLRSAAISPHIGSDLSAAFDRGSSRWLSTFETASELFPFGGGNNSSAFKILARALVEHELTEKVLLARAARKANGGRWPVTVPDFEKSAIEKRKWIYTVSGSRAMIRLEPTIDFPDLSGPAVQTRQELR